MDTMNQDTILLIIICILVIFYFCYVQKETLDNVSLENELIIDQIYNYIKSNPNGDFVEYANFLIGIKNTNLHIIDTEVFALFKGSNKRNKFTKDDIVTEMKLNE
jgi:hypothetical protein